MRVAAYDQVVPAVGKRLRHVGGVRDGEPEAVTAARARNGQIGAPDVLIVEAQDVDPLHARRRVVDQTPSARVQALDEVSPRIRLAVDQPPLLQEVPHRVLRLRSVVIVRPKDVQRAVARADRRDGIHGGVVRM
ncbi:MAG: hypothetical protein E6G59_01330, partial [Actinobacteria bacterium]